MNFWPALGATYWGNGDEGCVRAWAGQLKDWVMDNTAPASAQSILAPWATIQAAERMRNTWPDTFFRCVLNYTVQASTNLIHWNSLITTNPPIMPLYWNDLESTNFSSRFYRVLLNY